MAKKKASSTASPAPAGQSGAALTKTQGPAPPPVAGTIGPNMRELARVALAARSLQSTAELDLGGERILLDISLHNSPAGQYLWVNHTRYQTQGSSSWHGSAASFEAGMRDLAILWAKATLKIDTITAKASKCELRHGPLRVLAVAAWCEAFGVAVPTAEELAALDREVKTSRGQTHAEMLQELRSGPSGVEKWNARQQEERERAGRFRKLDLAGLWLGKIVLSELDFQNTVFDEADLRGALLDGADLGGASFKGAQLVGARLAGCRLGGASFVGANLGGANVRAIKSFRDVDFQGADLRESDFSHSDLRGADLSGSRLDDAVFCATKFDEQTRFPPGFVLPQGLEWSGTGPDPRLPSLFPPPAAQQGFDAFLAGLREQVDSARLSKALAMLKAERFQLFSLVEPDSLLGVVRSQGDRDLVYSCRLGSDGSYSCCTQNLNPCGGLRGALCKHLLVLAVGLTKAGQLDPATALAWVAGSRAHKPALDREQMSATLLRYKGAVAGEVDWRPTETIPEDYYSL